MISEKLPSCNVCAICLEKPSLKSVTQKQPPKQLSCIVTAALPLHPTFLRAQSYRHSAEIRVAWRNVARKCSLKSSAHIRPSAPNAIKSVHPRIRGSVVSWVSTTNVTRNDATAKAPITIEIPRRPWRVERSIGLLKLFFVLHGVTSWKRTRHAVPPSDCNGNGYGNVKTDTQVSNLSIRTVVWLNNRLGWLQKKVFFLLSISMPMTIALFADSRVTMTTYTALVFCVSWMSFSTNLFLTTCLSVLCRSCDRIDLLSRCTGCLVAKDGTEIL